MAEDRRRAAPERRRLQRRRPHDEGLDATGPQAHSPAPAYSPALLHDARLSGRGNGPVRMALVQQMQQTRGNRAVQRALRQVPTPLGQRTQVQRRGRPAAVIQRKIGFEFEADKLASWKLLRPMTPTEWNQPPETRVVPPDAYEPFLKKKDRMYAGPGFRRKPTSYRAIAPTSNSSQMRLRS